MADNDAKLHTEKLLARAASSDKPREGAEKTWQPTAQAFHLELLPRKGCPETFAWHQYKRGKLFTHENPERLVLLFVDSAAVITGHNLQQVLDVIGTERCERIQEHDRAEAGIIDHENEHLAAAHRKAIILSVRGEPDFDELFNAITERGEKHEDNRHEAPEPQRNHGGHGPAKGR